MSTLPLIQKAEVAGQTVLLRSDLDVPLIQTGDTFSIDEDLRLVCGMATVTYLLSKGAKVIMMGHLGRPKGVVDPTLSLLPVARWFAQKFEAASSGFYKEQIGAFEGWRITDNFFLLENIRFYEGEEKNDENFAKKLAELGQLYVNDAFAMSHRQHASVVLLPTLLPHFAGIRLQEEIEVLEKLLVEPKRPLVVLMGGKKLETKLPLVEEMLKVADFVLVGGLISKEIEENHPIFSPKIKLGRQNSNATDIQQVSVEEFIRVINTAQTIIWNGSMGLIGSKTEHLESEKGTENIAKAVTQSKAFSVVGGGDTVEFLNKMGILDKFGFVSTGGGAMLSLLSGEKLPGIEALRRG